MAPRSVLEYNITSQGCQSIYLNKAASCKDPLERLKLVMASSMANLIPGKIYEKPLNPVLGETYEAVAVDGAKIFME